MSRRMSARRRSGGRSSGLLMIRKIPAPSSFRNQTQCRAMPKTDAKQASKEIPMIELEGILAFANIPFPEKGVRMQLQGRPDFDKLYERIEFGFYMAKAIVSLYGIEVMLKYSHQQIDKRNGKEIEPRYTHDIGTLFKDLPPAEKDIIQAHYIERGKNILKDKRASCITPLQSLVDILECDAITDLRYYWDRPKGEEGKKLPSYHNDMEALSYGIAVGLLDYRPARKP